MAKRKKSKKPKTVSRDMTVLEMAQHFGISRALAQQWVEALPLKSKYKDGRRWMIRAEAVNRLADEEERAKITGKSTKSRKSHTVRALENAVKPLEARMARVEQLLERIVELLEALSRSNAARRKGKVQ
ncbi:hypothetical protein ACFL59_03505 [Planctomycetota bacterium]